MHRVSYVVRCSVSPQTELVTKTVLPAAEDGLQKLADRDLLTCSKQS